MSILWRITTAVWLLLAIFYTLCTIAALVLGTGWTGLLSEAITSAIVAALMRGITNRDRQLKQWRDAAHADIKSGAIYVSPEKRDRILEGLDR